MGGRGRGGGAGSTVRAVANALGIARHEMASFQQPARVEPPTNYPVLNRGVLPLSLEDDSGLMYMVEVKLEINTRFHQSEFYLDHKEKKDVRRYTDKYNEMTRAKFKPDFSRIPDELCWQKEKNGKSAKRRKLDPLANGDIIAAKLNKLEKEEINNTSREEPEDAHEDEEEEEKGSEKDDVEAPSDDDYAEEDNDYISAYFDNGEGYGEGGSDDNMDGDEY